MNLSHFLYRHLYEVSAALIEVDEIKQYFNRVSHCIARKMLTERSLNNFRVSPKFVLNIFCFMLLYVLYWVKHGLDIRRDEFVEIEFPCFSLALSIHLFSVIFIFVNASKNDLVKTDSQEINFKWVNEFLKHRRRHFVHWLLNDLLKLFLNCSLIENSFNFFLSCYFGWNKSVEKSLNLVKEQITVITLSYEKAISQIRVNRNHWIQSLHVLH